jgi:hypothetical protein
MPLGGPKMTSVFSYVYCHRLRQVQSEGVILRKDKNWMIAAILIATIAMVIPVTFFFGYQLNQPIEPYNPPTAFHIAQTINVDSTPTITLSMIIAGEVGFTITENVRGYEEPIRFTLKVFYINDASEEVVYSLVWGRWGWSTEHEYSIIENVVLPTSNDTVSLTKYYNVLWPSDVLELYIELRIYSERGITAYLYGTVVQSDSRIWQYIQLKLGMPQYLVRIDSENFFF